MNPDGASLYALSWPLGLNGAIYQYDVGIGGDPGTEEPGHGARESAGSR